MFEQVPYVVSGGSFGLGLTISGVLIFFRSWRAWLIRFERERAELIRPVLDRAPGP